MGKTIRLTESDLNKLVNRIIKEQGLAGNASTGQAKQHASPRIYALADYLKKYSYTSAEIQQAQSQLKTPQAPVKPVVKPVAKPAATPNEYTGGE